MLSKYHKYLLGIALVLSSIAISIRGSNGPVKPGFGGLKEQPNFT
jgi:hypothetical protein